MSAKTFAASVPSSPGPTDTIDLSRAEALVEPHAHVVPAPRTRQGGFAMAYSVVTVLTIAVAFAGYVIVRGADREATLDAPAPPPPPTRPAPEPLPAKEFVDLPAPEQVAQEPAALLHQLQHIAAEFLGIGDPVGAKVDLDRHRLRGLGSFLLHRASPGGMGATDRSHPGRLFSTCIRLCQTYDKMTKGARIG